MTIASTRSPPRHKRHNGQLIPRIKKKKQNRPSRAIASVNDDNRDTLRREDSPVGGMSGRLASLPNRSKFANGTINRPRRGTKLLTHLLCRGVGSLADHLGSIIKSFFSGRSSVRPIDRRVRSIRRVCKEILDRGARERPRERYSPTAIIGETARARNVKRRCEFRQYPRRNRNFVLVINTSKSRDTWDCPASTRVRLRA